ncbi:hypothetical protein MLD38_013621 [Melastoma candidum]|uniref:Uncharacterized protein n=1 Tax=Melastoma candidum TaxID=119954 RepID=A0ACB9RA54_9MYRT|nr:hypothetical protein MLD38_013621 [Melastoma candidum]
MCIAVFLWQAHSTYQLYLLHNRDEYHERPADPLRWWDDRGILGGRDGQAGGTWLACSRSGRVAFVTNVREVEKLDQPRSRGDLPVRFLESKQSPYEFADEVLKELHQYNGFNLIVANVVAKTMLFITNRPAQGGVYVSEVSPGIHVLSNASLNTPWPKAQLLRRGFEELIMEGKDRGEIPDMNLALELLTNRTKDGENLPGVLAPEWEYMLSSPFVEAETSSGLYGTRSMSALCVRTDGEVNFHEKCLDDGEWKEHHVSYKIESNV